MKAFPLEVIIEATMYKKPYVYTYAVTCLKCPCYKNMLEFIYQHIL